MESQSWRRAAAFLRPSSSAFGILNSSSLWPVFRAATSHLGCFPRPDHVSDGLRGLQYLGRTFGYLRRGVRLTDGRLTRAEGLIASTRFSRANRFSSSCFSAMILSDSISVSCSWISQSSSNSIAVRSGLRIVYLETIERQFGSSRSGTLNRSVRHTVA